MYEFLERDMYRNNEILEERLAKKHNDMLSSSLKALKNAGCKIVGYKIELRNSKLGLKTIGKLEFLKNHGYTVK